MRSNERSGLLYALAGFATLTIGDTVVKTMAGQWPPTAVAGLRYVFALIGLGVLLYRSEGRAIFAMPSPWIQLLRGAGMALAAVCFFSAVFVMPLADAAAISFTSPMIIALLAAVFLREPARRSTVIASLIAFGGVLVILRPNFLELGWAALLPLGSAVGFSVTMIGNRLSANKGSALAMQYYVAVMAAPILIVAAIAGHYSGLPQLALHWPSWGVVLRCAFVSVSATIGLGLIYLGTIRAGPAVIAPMTYVQLLTAAACGYLVFGNVPDLAAVVGAVIIVGAGLYLWRASGSEVIATSD